jgi:dihydroorotate dehydrogenase electron transfer subunit
MYGKTPHKVSHSPRIVTVMSKRRESTNVTTLNFSSEGFPVVEPGQFFMVWYPGKEEIPIAISAQTNESISISIDAIGETSQALSDMKPGEILGVRGPYGNGFDLDSGSCYLLVGSGCGASPLNYAANRLHANGKRFDIVIDARGEAELCFVDGVADSTGVKPLVSTHDGSVGYAGYGSALAEKFMNEKTIDYVITCGPEPMMKALHRLCIERGVKFQASLERYIRCGFGICGSCGLDPTGLLVCKDGPIFDGEALAKVPDFNTQRRARDGSPEKI